MAYKDYEALELVVPPVPIHSRSTLAPAQFSVAPLLSDRFVLVHDAAIFHQPLPAISRTVRQMEQDGLAERFADPADRRKTLVRFTPKGYEACRQCEAALGDYFSSVMARLEPEQLAQMEALRGALMEAILAENAARTTKPKGEPNHDKDL